MEIGRLPLRCVCCVIKHDKRIWNDWLTDWWTDALTFEQTNKQKDKERNKRITIKLLAVVKYLNANHTFCVNDNHDLTKIQSQLAPYTHTQAYIYTYKCGSTQ